jgi:hypothetical protein
MKRNDDALPIATTVAQLPIVLHDGTLLIGPGLHRPSGVVFCIAPELMRILPQPAECTPEVVGEAMRFLCEEWLVDVATDYAAKCTIVASALTIIERALLSERPAFFMTAGQRGGGKTTLIHMISMAILGIAACAHAWSKDEDERRKALLSYFSAGLPMLTWDNIARGSTISCPHIERALTNEFYSDRVLGATQHRLVLTSTVQFFTGNNIGPRGDTASRSLIVRLAVDRPDPENRTFKHPDPLAWTEANRGRILAALFTILMGNPRRRGGANTPPETRFKTWWDIVGSAVENAAREHARLKPGINAPRFRDLFLSGEDDEEQSSSLATVLDVLRRKWPGEGLFQASEVAAYAGQIGEEAIAFRGALELACGTPIKITSATVINWRLKSIADAPVVVGNEILVLQYVKPDRAGRNGGFKVVARPSKNEEPEEHV